MDSSSVRKGCKIIEAEINSQGYKKKRFFLITTWYSDTFDVQITDGCSVWEAKGRNSIYKNYDTMMDTDVLHVN